MLYPVSKSMGKKFAKAVSYLFHPLLMPLLGFTIIAGSGTYAANLDRQVIQHITLIIFGVTFIMPLAFIPLYLYTRVIKNVQMDLKRERIVPFYVTLMFYVIAYVLLKNTSVSYVYATFMLSACLVLFLVFVISLFWKISAHLAGIGGIVALVLSMSVIFRVDMMGYLIGTILLAGIVAYARLRLDAHSPLQVYAGFFTGFIVVTGVFLYS